MIGDHGILAPKADVVREVLEETGIHVEVDQLTGVYENTTRGIVALVFPCRPSVGTERTSSESTAVDRLTPEGVSERVAEVFAIRLLDLLDDNGPHVRSHDGRQLIRRQGALMKHQMEHGRSRGS